MSAYDPLFITGLNILTNVNRKSTMIAASLYPAKTNGRTINRLLQPKLVFIHYLNMSAFHEWPAYELMRVKSLK